MPCKASLLLGISSFVLVSLAAAAGRQDTGARCTEEVNLLRCPSAESESSYLDTLDTLRPPQGDLEASEQRRKVLQAGSATRELRSFSVASTYKGSWRRLGAEQPSLLLGKESGSIFFRITAGNESLDGVRRVEGEVVVRDGELHSEDDLVLQLSGWHVAATGRLHGILQPTSGAAQTALARHDIRNRTPAYRQTLLSLAHDWHRIAQAQEEEQESQILERLSDPVQKNCDFALDTAVYFRQSPSEPDDTEQECLEGDEACTALNGTMTSRACGISLSLHASSTQMELYYAKAVRYTLMITVLSFVQIFLLLPQIEAASAPVTISKVSLLTVGQQAIMDAYLCLLHLTTGIMVDPLFNSFATAAFLEFVIFAIFEMRLLLMIWRVRRQDAPDPWAQQRELSILYARFYSALLGGIFVSYQLQRFMPLIVFGAFSFWIPQIVLCAFQNARQPLKLYYIIGMSLSRLALPLYLYGCPSNLLRNAASPLLCVLLSAYLTCQVVLLVGQTYYGPRFFIPKKFLPPKYDYHRPYLVSDDLQGSDIETGDSGLECVICMCAVDATDPLSRMLTPCNHMFHTACLQRWMDVKLECPTCRTPLPLS